MVIRSAKKNWQTLGILLIFIVFFFLRLYRLGYHDLWYDEIFTISYAKFPWFNWNAPLYWILLHFWTKIFIVSEFSLRFPSLIFSFLSVILVFFLGKDLFEKKIGIIASILMGLSPFHLWYAQEARNYSMVLFFGLLSSSLLYKALKKDKIKLWLFFILTSLIGLYTSYFYIPLFFIHGLCFIFFKRPRSGLKGAVYFLIAALGFSFYLPRFFSKFNYVWQGFWVPVPSGESLVITFGNFILGYNGLPVFYSIANILVIIFFASALLAVLKRDNLRRNFIFCFILFFLPILVFFLFSKFFFSVYLDRGLIIFSPYFYIIISLGIFYLTKKIRVVLFGTMMAIIFIADFGYFNDWMVMPVKYHTGAYIKKPIKPIVKFLKRNFQPADKLSFTNSSVVPSISFYSNQEFRFPYYFFDPRLLDTNWQRPVKEDKYHVPFYKIGNLEFNNLWVIMGDWERKGNLDKNSKSVKSWLDRHFNLVSSSELDGLWIFKYKK